MRFLVVLIISIYNTTALAQKLDRAVINQSLNGIKSVPLKHNSLNGIWFSTKDAEIILQLIDKHRPEMYTND